MPYRSVPLLSQTVSGFADVMPEVVRAVFDSAYRKLPGPDLRLALADCAAVEPREFERRVGELISELGQTHAVPKAEMATYLGAFPATDWQLTANDSASGGANW